MSQALRYAPRSHETVGVGIIDLDRFKVINDTPAPRGRRRSPATRGQSPRALRPRERHLRPPRGDEFTVLLQAVRGPENITVIARRIIDAFKRSFTIAGQQVHPTVSIGLALAHDDRVPRTHHPTSDGAHTEPLRTQPDIDFLDVRAGPDEEPVLLQARPTA